MQIASEPAAVQFKNVSKRYRLSAGMTLVEFLPALVRRTGRPPAFHGLRNLSFTVARGETLGIIGRNGSGKSTVLKLVAGVTAPSEGEVLVSGRISSLLELGSSFHPDLTGSENVFLSGSILGLTNREVRDRFDEIVDFAGIAPFIDTPVKHYSSGMYVRLAFSVAALSKPDILLVDEGLAVGDAEFQAKCLDKMRSFRAEGVTILLVTHSESLARSFCDRLLLLDRGLCVAEGSPSSVIRAYAEANHPAERLVAARPS